MADVVEQDDRGGLSRRQLIKASAVAGAAAWTAPMIIDSLSSPAAAGSQCVSYYAVNSGPCSIATQITQYGASTSPSSGQLPKSPVTVGSYIRLDVSDDCTKWIFLRVHYGNGGSCGSGDQPNHCEDITATCVTEPPTSGCGCISANGKSVYFQSNASSGYNYIWCC